MKEYEEIARIIRFLNENPGAYYDEGKIMQALDYSKSDFSELFSKWAGISPKQFLSSINPATIAGEINDVRPSLFSEKIEVTVTILQNEFVSILPMLAGEQMDNSLVIDYTYADSPFGKLLIASTSKGICFMAFYHQQKDAAMQLLRKDYPNATFVEAYNDIQENALSFFTSSQLPQIKLHIKGTDFQVKVWNELLKIPIGHFTSYKKLALQINQPSAARAVGTAIGSNSVAYFIPCHRVVRTGGKIGEFKWGGSTRKIAINTWEKAYIRRQAAPIQL